MQNIDYARPKSEASFYALIIRYLLKPGIKPQRLYLTVKEPSFYLLREGLDELRRKHPAKTLKRTKSSIVLKQETHYE